MNCAQIEFLAEEEPVYIVPNFREEVLNFIAGDVGPFIPGAPIKVPLWLAISLRKQNRCRIQVRLKYNSNYCVNNDSVS